MEHSIQHPRLGEVRGLLEDGVKQFRGIKFANLKDRFASPEIKEDYGGKIDATRHGPTVLCAPNSCEIEQNLLQQPGSNEGWPGMSDVDGLSLNISVPPGDHTKLPVLVFVQGGGFVGGNWFPHTDFGQFVKLSAEIGKPVIGVRISYRLGIAGFLISSELESLGYSANRGLQDVKAAFKWLAKNIDGFGGDGTNITAMGHSAGSAAAMLTLHSPEPLYKRLILHGGSALGMLPIPKVVAEASYETVIAGYGLKDLSPKERLEGLLKLPQEKLLDVPFGANMMSCVDGTEIVAPIDLKVVLNRDEFAKAAPGNQWCEELMIGYCLLDSMIFEYIGLIKETDVAARFGNAVRKFVPTGPGADAILEAYDITPSTPDPEAHISALRFVNEFIWGVPAYLLAFAWPGKSYVYRWDEPNPWEGKYKGHATHGLELAHLFLNWADKLSEKQQTLAVAISKDLISFTRGEEPWLPLNKERGRRVYGPSEKRIAPWAPLSQDDTGAAARMKKLSDMVGQDICSDIARAYMFNM